MDLIWVGKGETGKPFLKELLFVVFVKARAIFSAI